MPAPVLRPLVVTGCARSGTSYMADVVGGLGLRFGHEVVFGPRTQRFDGWHGQDGDSSWLAAPFLDEVPDALVAHQLRHPLRVVRSLSGIGFLGHHSALALTADAAAAELKWLTRKELTRRGYVDASVKGPRPTRAFLGFLRHHAPRVFTWAPPIERSLAFWLEWTKLLRAHAHEDRYVAHHLERTDETTVVGLLDRIGLATTPEHVALVMSRVPTDTNTRRVHAFEWSDVPTSDLKAEAEDLADTLGYDVKDPQRLPREVLG